MTAADFGQTVRRVRQSLAICFWLGEPRQKVVGACYLKQEGLYLKTSNLDLKTTSDGESEPKQGNTHSASKRLDGNRSGPGDGDKA